MSDNMFAGEAISAGCWTPKCASCLGDYITAKSQIELGVMNTDGTEITLPELKDAITILPSWQTNNINGQIVMALCSLPCCLDHAMPKKESVQEKMTRSGLALPGTGGIN